MKLWSYSSHVLMSHLHTGQRSEVTVQPAKPSVQPVLEQVFQQIIFSWALQKNVKAIVLWSVFQNHVVVWKKVLKRNEDRKQRINTACNVGVQR